MLFISWPPQEPPLIAGHNTTPPAMKYPGEELGLVYDALAQGWLHLTLEEKGTFPTELQMT